MAVLIALNELTGKTLVFDQLRELLAYNYVEEDPKEGSKLQLGYETGSF